MNRLSALLVIAAFGLWAGPAVAELPNTAVVPGLVVKNIPPAVAQRYHDELKALVASKVTVAPGAAGACADAGCAKSAATGAKTRFAVVGSVVNSDEIYTVSLLVYDLANSSKQVGKAVCELCGAADVNASIREAFGPMAGAFAAPQPKAPPPPAAKPKPSEVGVEVISDPAGADVKLGGTVRGQTPIVINVKPGAHELVIEKEGFKPATRKVQALAKAVQLTVKLEKAPAAAVVAPPVTPAPVAPPLQPMPEAPAQSGGGYTAVGWGLNAGGVALAGVGVWLILLDGEITCTDGRGRRECPNVYNTKGIGAASLGVGAALLGAGITALILDPGEPADSQAIVAPIEGGGVVGLSGRF